MAEARENEIRSSKEMAVATNVSLQTERLPRDLFQGFTSTSTAAETHHKSQNETFSGDDCTDEDNEIELNLGLSLGGRFGVDKTPRKLKRSSSIVGTMPILREADESMAQPSVLYTAALTRTTSLPAETEEEWRKRKEMQTLRRMEAKRRRSGKQRNSRITSSSNCSSRPKVNLEEAGLRGSSTVGLETWVSAAKKGGCLQKRPCSRQGSVDSDGEGGGGGGGGGRSSSSVSELEGKPLQGSSNSCGEVRSPATISHSSEESSYQKEKPGASGTNTNPTSSKIYRPETDQPLRRHNSVDKRSKETMVEDMPCVFTKGEGPNGRRIDGILYKYGKGEEVRIMCVCHGNFLSPGEFVKHASGRDVDYPLRHIVVNTSSSASSFL